MTNNQGGIYGFFGAKLFKVTSSGRELVNSFGNAKSDFYNETENSNYILGSRNYIFPDSPSFFREYILNNSDLNNPIIKFEIEFYCHFKSRQTGLKVNFGYRKAALLIL